MSDGLSEIALESNRPRLLDLFCGAGGKAEQQMGAERDKLREALREIVQPHNLLGNAIPQHRVPTSDLQRIARAALGEAGTE